jgi:hypothetical protein
MCFTKTKQKKFFNYFNTLLFSWMSLLDALDFTVNVKLAAWEDLSNPKSTPNELYIFGFSLNF